MSELPKIDLAPFVAEWENQQHNSDQYLAGYWPLLSYGEKVASRDDLIVLAHAVYGWMPTILDHFEFSETFPASTFLADVRSGVLPDEPVVNGSWIGTSKLLHFLAPTIWPIWDRRVAVHFGLRHFSQQNKREAYSSYASFLREEAPKHENPTAYSDIRFLELCLFSYRS